MAERSDGQSAVSISIPTKLLEGVDKRAAELGLPRSQYFAILASRDIAEQKPLVLGMSQPTISDAGPLSPEIQSLLLKALPEMIQFENQVVTPPIKPFDAYPDDVRNLLWSLFSEARQEILRHKWLESEKLKADIGMEVALKTWLQRHSRKWMEYINQQAGKQESGPASTGSNLASAHALTATPAVAAAPNIVGAGQGSGSSTHSAQ